MLGFRNFNFTGGQSTTISTSVPAPTLGGFGLYKVLDNVNAFGTSAGNNFGFAVANSESYAIVSAYIEDDAGGVGSGKAYIYSTTTGLLLYTLDNPNAYSTSGNDQFGTSVGISELYAIVGAPTEDDAGGTDSGKAYIYSTTTGSLLYTLDNPNAYSLSGSDFFGQSVAITNSYAIVGATGEDDAGGNGSGKAYIYSTTTGSLLYTLDNPNAYSTSAADNFGSSVGISQSYAIVSAPGEDDAGGISSGKAYIYSTTTGSLLYTLNNQNHFSTSLGDNFGFAVAISESYAIVSATGEDDSDGTSSGKAYIYSTSTGSLLYILNDPNNFGTSASDNFGQSVAISESYAIVGANGEDETNGTNSGKAYIYDMQNGGSLSYVFDNPNSYASPVSDFFGRSVGISNSYAIVGANTEDDAGGADSGKSYLYTRIEDNHITVTPSWFNFVASISGTATAITIPSTAQVGDIAVLFDTSTTVTDTSPSGWTSISKTTTTGIRTNISYRVLTSGQPGSSITGMAGTTRKVLTIFRNTENATPTVSLSTPGSQATTAAPSNQTITAGSGNSIYFACYASTTTTSPTRGFIQSGFVASELSSISTSRIYVKYSVRDSGVNNVAHASATITMTDAGTNTLQSFRMDIS